MAVLRFAATFDESCRILQSILDRGDLYAVEEYVRDPQEAEHITQITEEMLKRAKKFLVRYQLKDSEVRLWIGRESRELLESGQLCLYWPDKHYSAGKWYPGPRPEQWPVPASLSPHDKPNQSGTTPTAVAD